MTEAPEERPEDELPEADVSPGDYVPEADAVEQWTPAQPDEEAAATNPHAGDAVPPASEWDEAEQAVAVPLDDEDYR